MTSTEPARWAWASALAAPLPPPAQPLAGDGWTNTRRKDGVVAVPLMLIVAGWVARGLLGETVGAASVLADATPAPGTASSASASDAAAPSVRRGRVRPMTSVTGSNHVHDVYASSTSSTLHPRIGRRPATRADARVAARLSDACGDACALTASPSAASRSSHCVPTAVIHSIASPSGAGVA